jgi:hypothetical protein
MANGTTTTNNNNVGLGAAAGGAITDLVSTQKGGVQNLGQLVSSISNSMPVAGTATSPKATGVNNIGTASGTSVLGSSSIRHGMLFHNPGSNDVYVYPSALSPAPTTTTLGGTLRIVPGDTVPFPAVMWPNQNSAFSAIALTGTTNPLTIWEFL